MLPAVEGVHENFPEETLVQKHSTSIAHAYALQFTTENPAEGGENPSRDRYVAHAQGLRAALGGLPLGQHRGPPANLERRQHFDSYVEAVRAHTGPSYLVSLKQYLDGGIKLVALKQLEPPRVVYERKDGMRVHETVLPDSNSEGGQQAARRAKIALHDWVRQTAVKGTVTRLCTGTWRNAPWDRREAQIAVARMERLLGRHYPRVRMVTVYELHTGGGANDGGWHVHALLVAPQGLWLEYGIFQRLWYRAQGGTGKETGAETPGCWQFSNKVYKTPAEAARYLVKYMMKGYVGRKWNERRYSTTHGCPEVKRRYWLEPLSMGGAVDVEGRLREEVERQYPSPRWHVWSGRQLTQLGETIVVSAEPTVEYFNSG